MKTLFTLVVAAFAAVTVFAQTKDVCLRNYKSMVWLFKVRLLN